MLLALKLERNTMDSKHLISCEWCGSVFDVRFLAESVDPLNNYTMTAYTCLCCGQEVFDDGDTDEES